MADIIELRLPLKPEYLPVPRAAIGVIAGGISFNYDEIIQLRTAVGEAFELTIRGGPQDPRAPAWAEVIFRFVVEPEKIEVLIINPGNGASRLPMEGEAESQALLEGLMDEVEFGDGTGGKALIRMVKYNAVAK